MIQIDENYYYLDLDAINDWIFINEKDTGSTDKQTVLSGGEENIDEDGNIELSGDDTVQVTIQETSPGDKYASVRNDIIKEMLLTLYNAGVESEEGTLHYAQKLSELSLGSKIVINSFLEKGILKDKLKNKSKNKSDE